MSSKVYALSMAPELMMVIKQQSHRQYVTTSEYIKQAVITRLKVEGVFDDVMRLRDDAPTYDELRRQQLTEFLKEELKTYDIR